jgi:hypothetical protein
MNDTALLRASVLTSHMSGRQESLALETTSTKEEGQMMKRLLVLSTFALLTSGSAAIGADNARTLVVTSSNSANNQLLVYDTEGTLVESVTTLGQGGVDGNAGGIATQDESVAVVNFGSQSVTVFSRGVNGFELRQLLPTLSPPVSVAFGKDHLYVLGTTTVESHRIGGDGIESSADGSVVLLAADASAAQVGIVGNQLIVTEKSGTIELVPLRAGAVDGTPVLVTLPADSRDTPFGLVTRGSSAYVTIAGSDVVGLIKNARLIALAATGTPGGPGQHAPCWIAVVGPYLFTANSPSHSISRLVAGGQNLVLDLAVAAQTAGAPIDIAAHGDRLVVVESNGGGVSHLTQFTIDEDGNLTQTVSSAVAGSANGVAFISEK